MNKLEFYILKIFQEMLLKQNYNTRYVKLEDNLLALIKTESELDLFIRTELILDGRSLPTFKFEKIIDGLYKVEWSDLFLYIIGSKDKSEVQPSLISKEVELIRVSSSPLSNYIKTL